MRNTQTPNAPSVQENTYLGIGKQLIADIKQTNEIKKRMRTIAKSDEFGALYEQDLWDAENALSQIITLMGDMIGHCVMEEVVAGNEISL